MKLVHVNQVEKTLTVIPEVLDDFWHLTHVIEPGDILKGSTDRKIKGKEGQDSVRVKLFVELRVERIDFDQSASQLRVNGIILSGKPEELIPVKSHQSLELELGQRITIHKTEFKQYQLDRIHRAEKAMYRKSILAIIVDDERADLFELKEFKADLKLSLFSNKSGKRFAEEEWQSKFFSEIEKKVKSLGCEQIVIAGPGFTKEDLLAYLKDRVNCKLYLESVTSMAHSGVNELLQSPVMQKLVCDTQFALESKLMDQALMELGHQSGKVTYGIDHVRNAISLRAVDIILVSDQFLADHRSEVETLMSSCEKQNGAVHIFSKETSAGQKLIGLGGLVALLRYRVE